MRGLGSGPSNRFGRFRIGLDSGGACAALRDGVSASGECSRQVWVESGPTSERAVAPGSGGLVQKKQTLRVPVALEGWRVMGIEPT